MRYATSRRIRHLATLLLAVFFDMLSGVSHAQPVVVLSPHSQVVDLQSHALSWIDVGAQATIKQVAMGKNRPIMQPVQANTIFGLIMERVASRKPVTDMAAQLIASGLMPLRGLKPALALEFHVAAALLNEKQLADEADLSSSLFALLAGMAERTRRPICFLENARTMPTPLEAHAARSKGRNPAVA